MTRPEAPGRPEQPVLEDALDGWIDLLRKEAARRAGTHPLWAHISQGFASGGLTEQARERFSQAYRDFQSAWPTRSSARPGPSTSSWRRTRCC